METQCSLASANFLRLRHSSLGCWLPPGQKPRPFNDFSVTTTDIWLVMCSLMALHSGAARAELLDPWESIVMYPDFENAIQQFKMFLQSQSWPIKIRWIGTDQLIDGRRKVKVRLSDATAAEARARVAFDQAVTKGLGVALRAHCTIGESTCASVEAPEDALEAEFLMFPGGLKLTVAVPKRSASAV